MGLYCWPAPHPAATEEPPAFLGVKRGDFLALLRLLSAAGGATTGAEGTAAATRLNGMGGGGAGTTPIGAGSGGAGATGTATRPDSIGGGGAGAGGPDTKPKAAAAALKKQFGQLQAGLALGTGG